MSRSSPRTSSPLQSLYILTLDASHSNYVGHVYSQRSSNSYHMSTKGNEGKYRKMKIAVDF